MKRRILVTGNSSGANICRLVCQRECRKKPAWREKKRNSRPSFKGAADRLQKIELKLTQPVGFASIPPK